MLTGHREAAVATRDRARGDDAVAPIDVGDEIGDLVGAVRIGEGRHQHAGALRPLDHGRCGRPGTDHDLLLGGQVRRPPVVAVEGGMRLGDIGERREGEDRHTRRVGQGLDQLVAGLQEDRPPDHGRPVDAGDGDPDGCLDLSRQSGGAVHAEHRRVLEDTVAVVGGKERPGSAGLSGKPERQVARAQRDHHEAREFALVVAPDRTRRGEAEGPANAAKVQRIGIAQDGIGPGIRCRSDADTEAIRRGELLLSGEGDRGAHRRRQRQALARIGGIGERDAVRRRGCAAGRQVDGIGGHTAPEGQRR